MELHFSVGAALCSAALGVNSPERFSRWEVKEQDSIPNEKDMMEWLLDEILTKYVVHRIPAARQVGSELCEIGAKLQSVLRLKSASNSYIFFLWMSLALAENLANCV